VLPIRIRCYCGAGLDAAGGEAVCPDADVVYSTVAALQRPPDWLDAKAARTLAERCWETLGTAVVEKVAHAVSPNKKGAGLAHAIKSWRLSRHSAANVGADHYAKASRPNLACSVWALICSTSRRSPSPS
jgi:hypothetical protein